MTMEVEEYRAMRYEIIARKNLLIDSFEATFNEKPKDTLDLLEEKIGKDKARLAVAEVVRLVDDWDGRIRPDTRKWADSVPEGLTREEMNQMGIHIPGIHPAYINQLAQEYIYGSRSEQRQTKMA